MKVLDPSFVLSRLSVLYPGGLMTGQNSNNYRFASVVCDVLNEAFDQFFRELHVPELSLAAARFREVDREYTRALKECEACRDADVGMCPRHATLGHLYFDASNALEDAARKTGGTE